MRQFLYLDTDIVNSIIAQENKGLIDNITTERGKEKGSQETKALEILLEGSAEGGLLKLAKAEAALEVAGNLEKQNSASSNAKEIIAKTLHDAAFDMAHNAINPIVIPIGDDRANLGQYIELTRVFDFIDLEYLDCLFSKDGLIEFLKKTEKEKIESQTKEFTEQVSKNNSKQAAALVKKKIRELIQESDKQYDGIHDVVSALKQIAPYSRMLLSGDGYLIPVEDKYFRVNPTNMGFKFGGEIKCIGMITNIIGEDTNPNDDNNLFATLQFTVNEVVRSILPTSENNLYVVHPLAIYYES